jgi:hypothetical protein
MLAPADPIMGSGVPLWYWLQYEPFGSSDAYATVGLGMAAVDAVELLVWDDAAVAAGLGTATLALALPAGAAEV